MRVKVLDSPFDAWREMAAHQEALPALRGKHGATAVFVGAMRDFNAGSAVSGMTLEHYPAMTARTLEELCREAERRWAVLETLIVHRAGDLKPDDTIVLVAVWSAHRAEAFDACRYLIEELKTRAPFWKQEQTPSGRRWVGSEED